MPTDERIQILKRLDNQKEKEKQKFSDLKM
jgi:hypothetical protein